MVYPALLPLMRTPRLPVVDCTDASADLNGLACFGERRNLVSARVPSHFKRSLQHDYFHENLSAASKGQRIHTETHTYAGTDMSAVSQAYFFVQERQVAKQNFDNPFLFSTVLTAQAIVLL